MGFSGFLVNFHHLLQVDSWMNILKKQMKLFAIQLMEEYAKSTDNDIDDAIVLKVKKAMRLGLG